MGSSVNVLVALFMSFCICGWMKTCSVQQAAPPAAMAWGHRARLSFDLPLDMHGSTSDKTLYLVVIVVVVVCLVVPVELGVIVGVSTPLSLLSFLWQECFHFDAMSRL